MNTPRTPREILLARHAASARAALDAQRDALLSRFAADAASASEAPDRPLVRPSLVTSLRDLFAVLHRELFAPYRRSWSALACVWLAILAFQQLDRLSAPPLAPARLASSAPAADTALLALWLEQRRQLAALAADSGMGDPLVSPTRAPTREKVPTPAGSRPLGVLSPPRLAIA